MTYCIITLGSKVSFDIASMDAFSNADHITVCIVCFILIPLARSPSNLQQEKEERTIKKKIVFDYMGIRIWDDRRFYNRYKIFKNKCFD